MLKKTVGAPHLRAPQLILQFVNREISLMASDWGQPRHTLTVRTASNRRFESKQNK